MRILSEESLERSRGREEKFSMKITVKVREIERETKHLFTTVSFQVTFSFLIYALLPHIYSNNISNNISNNDDYFCTLYRSIIISMYSILLSGVRNRSSAFRLG